MRFYISHDAFTIFPCLALTIALSGRKDINSPTHFRDQEVETRRISVLHVTWTVTDTSLNEKQAGLFPLWGRVSFSQGIPSYLVRLTVKRYCLTLNLGTLRHNGGDEW